MSVEADVKYTAHIQPLTSCLNNSISLYLTRLSRVKRKKLNWRLHFCKVALVWSKRMRTHTHTDFNLHVFVGQKRNKTEANVSKMLYLKRKNQKISHLYFMFFCAFQATWHFSAVLYIYIFFNLVIFKRWRIWRLLVKKVQFELLSFYFFK